MAIWDSIRARFSPVQATVAVSNATILQVVEANQAALLQQLATISDKVDAIANVLGTSGLAQLIGDLSLIQADVAKVKADVEPIAGDYQVIVGTLSGIKTIASEILAIVGPSKIVGDPTSIVTEHQPLPPR